MDNQSVNSIQFKKEIEDFIELVAYLPEGKTHVIFDGMYTIISTT